MAKLNSGLVGKLLSMISGNHAEIEEWTFALDPWAESSYILQIVAHIEDKFPSAKIIAVYKARNIEEKLFGEALFDGYRIKVKNIDPVVLKKTCMELEFNAAGARISDLDVYHRGKKISRKA